MALVLGSVLAAGLAVPLEQRLGGWQASLAFWALPALVAAVVVAAAPRCGPGTDGRARRRRAAARLRAGVGGQRRSSAMQSMAFYASLSWIPSILEDGGWSSEAAGGLLAFGALVRPACRRSSCRCWPRAPEHQLRLLLAIVLVPAAGLAGVLAAARRSRRCGWC